jgi:hypothetical protein
MLLARQVLRWAAIVAIPAVVLLSATSCSSTKSTTTKTTTTTGAGATTTTAGSSTTGSTAGSTSTTATAAAANVPSSCSAIPTALISSYIGSVGMTQSLKAAAGSVSCEFANAGASKVLILNIGKGGTPAEFATLRSISGAGGRTVTAINGLGGSAFSITRNGVAAGMAVLTSDGRLYAVTTNLSVAQDEALIKQLEKL